MNMMLSVYEQENIILSMKWRVIVSVPIYKESSDLM